MLISKKKTVFFIGRKVGKIFFSYVVNLLYWEPLNDCVCLVIQHNNNIFTWLKNLACLLEAGRLPLSVQVNFYPVGREN